MDEIVWRESSRVSAENISGKKFSERQTLPLLPSPASTERLPAVAALCSLANSAYAPEIKKLLPHSITGAPSVGMGICEWGKVEFFNFGLPFLAIFSLKGPE